MFYKIQANKEESTQSMFKTVFEQNDLAMFSLHETQKKAQSLSYFCVFNGQLFGNDNPNPAQFVLNGLEQHGLDFLDSLEGLYTICIICLKSNTTYLVRDTFGLMSLYYFYSANELFFGDNLNDFFNLDSLTISPVAIQKYLSFENTANLCSDATFFEEIKQVLPAHYLRIKAGKCTQHFYWKLNINQYATFQIADYTDKFKTLFVESIKNRISSQPVIANLSGGLDSSSICSIAQMIQPECQIHSVYIDTKHADSNEQGYAQEVIAKWDLEHTTLSPPKNLYKLSCILTKHSLLPDVLFIPSATFYPISERIKALGGEYILSGEGGDNVIATGTEYFDELFNCKQWPKLSQAFKDYCSKKDLSLYFPHWNTLSQAQRTEIYSNDFFFKKIITVLKQKQLKKAFGIGKMAKFHCGFSYKYFVSTLINVLKTRLRRSKIDTNVFKKSAINTIPATKNFDTNLEGLSVFQQEHLGYCFNNFTTSVLEQQHLFMNHFGQKIYYPFLDKKLFELSIAVPSEVRFNDGYGRGILREAMQGVLPEAVRLRTTKAAFTSYVYDAFIELWEASKPKLNKEHPLWQYVDETKFRKIIAFILNPMVSIKLKNKYLWTANRVIYLAIWLEVLKEKQRNS